MEKGTVGLQNRGNTCYLNTSIQCISHIIPLVDYFLTNNYVPDLNSRFQELKSSKINEIIFTKEFAKLVKALWNSDSQIEPKTIHELIQKYDDRFLGYEQQDSQESLSLILDYLHEGLKYDVAINYSGTVENELDEIMVESIKNWKKELNEKYSIIADLFFGQFINKVISLEESNKDQMVSKTFELFNILNVPIYGKTLYDSLAKYFEKETLESKYYVEKTKSYIDAYRQIKLMKVPKFIIIVLKRYKNQTGNLLKSNNIITFPIDDLDLTSYSEGYDGIDCRLKLISVGCHRGSLNGGHYFAICRHRNNRWYKYDDDTVSDFDISRNINNLFRDGYILIYQKLE
jgi:ubiquitin carboxyl-terminal hydrolase 8